MASFRQASADDSGVDQPVEFVRVCIGAEELRHRTVVHADRMSDDELAAIACQGGEDLMAEEEDEAEVQPVG